MNRISKLRHHLPMAITLLTTTVATVLSTTAYSQPNRGRGLPPEVRAKIQAVQVQSVADDLKLDTEATEKLKATFADFQKESARNRPEGGGRGDREAMRAHQKARQDKLAETLKGFLEEPKATQAAGILGGFNRGWDRMIQVVLGFELDEPKAAEALGHVLSFVKTGSEARAGGEQDFESMRGIMEAAKETLDTDIGSLLTETQQAEWKEKTARRQRGGRGGLGGGRGRGDVRGSDAGPPRGGRGGNRDRP
jgi:hypothetical protein